MEYDYHITGATGDFKLAFDEDDGSKGKINGKAFELDILETNTGYHVLQNNKAYRIDVLSIDQEKHQIELRINSKRYVFNVKDKYDELLEKLGMDMSLASKVLEIKAPMPGLVLDILVNEGDEVTQNMPLLILEAMKMENVIKSPNDGKVKSIQVKKGISVVKNQVLISFD